MSKLVFQIPNFPGKEKMVAVSARAMLKVSKHSPELCVAAGIVTGVGATVMACKATLRIDDALSAYHENLEKINFLENKIKEGVEVEKYSLEIAQRDKFVNFCKAVVSVGKLYAPAIILGGISIGFILGGHHILVKRNAALGMAYAGLQKAFDEYRGRVREAVGEETENDIFKGVKEVVVEEKAANGKVVKKKRNELGTPASPYTRIFDENSQWFSRSAEQNKYFLTLQQNHANDMLRLRGHLFLNEVFDMLDIPRCPMGATCGWIYGDGDSFVDFGMWDYTKQGVREFINGYEPAIVLDFNCDGVIYDLI